MEGPSDPSIVKPSGLWGVAEWIAPGARESGPFPCRIRAGKALDSTIDVSMMRAN